MAKLRQLVAGNWKMNGTAASLAEIDAVMAGIGNARCDVAICPPATLIAQAVWKSKGSALMIGGESAARRIGVPHYFTLVLVANLLILLALAEYLDHRRRRAG